MHFFETNFATYDYRLGCNFSETLAINPFSFLRKNAPSVFSQVLQQILEKQTCFFFHFGDTPPLYKLTILDLLHIRPQQRIALSF